MARCLTICQDDVQLFLLDELSLPDLLNFRASCLSNRNLIARSSHMKNVAVAFLDDVRRIVANLESRNLIKTLHALRHVKVRAEHMLSILRVSPRNLDASLTVDQVAEVACC